MARSGALAPLRHRGFRLLAGGQLASNLGDAFYAVALPWYVLATHGGALLLGTVLAAYGIPRMALVALGGHASDRFKPWTVMMVADGVRALAVGALAVLAELGPAHAVLLVPVAVVLGAGEGLFLPGSFSIVPSLLPDDDLQAGNSLASGGTQLATLVGPALGGAVVALVGPSSAFGVDAVTFVVSAFTLLGVRSHQGRAMAGAPHVDEIAVGPAVLGVEVEEDRSDAPGATERGPAPGEPREPPLSLRRLLASERALQVILVVTLAANLGFGGLSEVALPALAHGPFHTGAGGYGGLIAAFGGGALVGTLAAAHVRRPHRPALLASWVFLLDALVISVAPFLAGAVGMGAALVAFGALNGFGNIVAITAFQRWAPREFLGRLMGVLMLGSFGAFPVSVLLGGVVVRSLGAAALFPLAGGVLALAILGGLTQKSWRQFGGADADVSDPHDARALAVEAR